VRTLRFYVPLDLSEGGVIQAPDSTARHISQVLRLRVEDEIILFNGNDIEYSAQIVEIKKKSVLLKILDSKAVSKESEAKIHLIQAISKGDRMDWVIQKSVELGVSSIQPVTSKRNNVKLSSDRLAKKILHWQGIVASACEQCGRNTLPDIYPVLDLSSAIENLPIQHSTNRIILNPQSSKKLQSAEFKENSFSLAVGPEGGFDENEIAYLERMGFESYNLGSRILRTETAAISAIALLQALHGDL